MADIRYLNPATLHAPFGYSHVVEVKKGRTVFISGQIALDSSGNLVGKDDILAQTRQAFENLKLAVESVGGAMKDIVKLNFYLIDISRMQEIRSVRYTFFPDKERMPVSTAVEVARLALSELLVEIEAVAVID
jgi:enamine deaminase RidA (YjgF/YER057c/UK114 family)